jgi:glutamate synthase domain-containing protein 1/glutamate synthase domain-containing protein 3
MPARADAILAARRALPIPTPVGDGAPRKEEMEGGCGVIGIAANVPVAGRHLLQALVQMRNRGNGKGGGIAAAGLDPAFLGVTPEVLAGDYLVAVAYLDPGVREETERSFLAESFEIDHAAPLPPDPGAVRALGLPVAPPDVVCYFVRVRGAAREEFQRRFPGADAEAAEDEIVYRNTYRLNRALYASTGEKRAFVLSHAKDLLVLKMVGYGDDVIRAYRLENLAAHVWIGHHRYPTKGHVWHPGGAHPFIGMHEALVHNGDFANYASIVSYLAQRGIHPLFLTDTEVAVLVFDLHRRVYGYPLEYVIEAMAPTTERDFTLLPEDRRRLYAMLQSTHIHGSPDGPWFFLIAQSEPRTGAKRLIGITDTSMLRPQVFALQEGEASIGFAASEKQAIDAALGSLAAEDARFWSRADLTWNARGGSHTDGGAFTFTVEPDGPSGRRLVCADKFGRRIRADGSKRAPGAGAPGAAARPGGGERPPSGADSAEAIYDWARARIPSMGYGEVDGFLTALIESSREDEARLRALHALALLLDRPYPTGSLKRSGVLARIDAGVARLVDAVRGSGSARHAWFGADSLLPDAAAPDGTAIVDARGFPAEGEGSLSRAVVRLHAAGFRQIVIANARGQRFIGSGLGVGSTGLSIDVFGSSGDYLGSGIDGARISVHGSAQDQLGQILKDGTLVIAGDVGQTFLYGAKGGRAFVLGNAAGRPLINAVGRPRVVINGTCLDYLAESFMAGDPLDGGGFVVLNGVAFDEDGQLRDLETPYPGGNLFSLASGGAIYVRDPERKLTEDQLNGGEFAPVRPADWEVIRPLLEENERLFGVPVQALLHAGGATLAPASVYRKIRPSGHKALLPEEAWVRREA